MKAANAYDLGGHPCSSEAHGLAGAQCCGQWQAAMGRHDLENENVGYRCDDVPNGEESIDETVLVVMIAQILRHAGNKSELEARSEGVV